MGDRSGVRPWLLRALVRGAWVVFLCLGLSRAAFGAPSVEEIVTNLSRAGSQLPAEMGFRQDVHVRVLFLMWKFHSLVVRQNGQYLVETWGAPDFLPPGFMASLVEIGDALDNYDLELVGEEKNANGEPVYRLTGRRRHGWEGALGGTLWVNGRTWLVERAVLEYDWGTLEVQQDFHQVNGYTVLRSQRASASRMGARVTVEYRDYWFGNDDMIAREDH